MEMRQHLEQLEQALDGRPLRARRIQVLVSLLVVMYGVPTWAADAQGKYVASGIAVVRCQALTQEKHARGLDAFINWFAGYLSATNEIMPDTYDISGPHKDFWAVWLAWDTWLHNYCALNPLGDVMKATVAWKDSIYGTRQTRAPLEALPTPSVTVPPRPPSR